MSAKKFTCHATDSKIRPTALDKMLLHETAPPKWNRKSLFNLATELEGQFRRMCAQATAAQDLADAALKMRKGHPRSNPYRRAVEQISGELSEMHNQVNAHFLLAEILMRLQGVAIKTT